MPLSVERFVEQLADSGILASDTVRDFLPPQRHPKDAKELARELIRQKKLTKFQAEEVYKGNGKSLALAGSGEPFSRCARLSPSTYSRTIESACSVSRTSSTCTTCE